MGYMNLMISKFPSGSTSWISRGPFLTAYPPHGKWMLATNKFHFTPWMFCYDSTNPLIWNALQLGCPDPCFLFGIESRNLGVLVLDAH